MNYVYIHINKINGKRYVGLTTRKPERRWGHNGREYLQKKDGKYTQSRFANAILKYGWDNFDHTIYQVNTAEEMKYLEKYLIAYYETTNSKKGYNLTRGGDGGWGHTMPQWQRDLISENNRKRVWTRESRQKLSASLKGKKPSPEAVEKTRQRMSGRYVSPETREKMKQSRANSDLVKKQWRKVAQYQGDTLIKVYASIKEAAEAVGGHRTGIGACCRGKKKSSKGYKWTYYE